MPLPRWLGRFNVRVTNRILGPIVVRLPGYGRVVHVGRRSGREYRTPVMLFRHGGQVTFALTYGPDTEWVRNVLAAGSCRFETPGRILELRSPELVRDEARRLVPRPVRWALAVVRASDFLVMRVVAERVTVRTRGMRPDSHGGAPGAGSIRSRRPVCVGCPRVQLDDSSH